MIQNGEKCVTDEQKDVMREREGVDMELTATQEIICKLKSVKEQQGLSIPQIKEMVDATGTYLSLSTIRRVFADGSEESNSFSYENTIRPIAQALLIAYGLSSDDALHRARTETYEAILRHKNEQIENLQEELNKQREMMDERFREYEKRLSFLRDQIELKDKRMERKDGIIEKLMEKVL